MSGLVPHCGWCETTADELVKVGFHEAGSGPGCNIHACPECVKAYRILPLDEHPPDSWGGVRYRPAEATR